MSVRSLWCRRGVASSVWLVKDMVGRGLNRRGIGHDGVAMTEDLASLFRSPNIVQIATHNRRGIVSRKGIGVSRVLRLLIVVCHEYEPGWCLWPGLLGT